jgi:hypothetical protein
MLNIPTNRAQTFRLFMAKFFSRNFRFCLLAALLAAITLSGCAGPIGVTPVTPHQSYQLQAINPLSAGKMSNDATAVLHRYNLVASFEDAPLETILKLHDISRTDNRRDLLSLSMGLPAVPYGGLRCLIPCALTR